jgi:hypothetical protein
MFKNVVIWLVNRTLKQALSLYANEFEVKILLGVDNENYHIDYAKQGTVYLHHASFYRFKNLRHAFKQKLFLSNTSNPKSMTRDYSLIIPLQQLASCYLSNDQIHKMLTEELDKRFLTMVKQ